MSGRHALGLLRQLSFTVGLLALTLPALEAKGAKPEFGPNVLIFDPSMPRQAIEKQIDAIYAVQEHNEFSSQRSALLFLPGSYSVNLPVGFYTEVMGLGASPDATKITGNMHADANHEHNNATTTFWRAAEGLSIEPASGTMQWAVSQAVSLRRMHVRGDLVLHQHRGWASGGWMSDSLVDGNVDSGSQQQWISRNCDWKRWTGSNWNMVFVGVNCGFLVDGRTFPQRFAGQPLKRIALSFGDQTVRGEAMITAAGIEGGGVYALSAPLRDAIAATGEATCTSTCVLTCPSPIWPRVLPRRATSNRFRRSAQGREPVAGGHRIAAGGGQRAQQLAA